MEGLTEGRVVHFVCADGEHRAATIVKVWDHTTGVANLQVATDGTNDYLRLMPFAGHQIYTDGASALVVPSHVWITSVHFDGDGAEARTWHWIERA